MSTFEASPGRGPLERVVGKLSIETAKLGKEGGHAIPEFEPAEFVAMTAGMSDPIGREIAGVIAEHYHAVNQAVQQLNLWGWNRWLIDWPDRSISGRLHGKMAFAVVADYQAGGKGYELRDIRQFLNVNDQQFTKLIPHWAAMQRRMMEGESKMVQHIVRQLRDEYLDAA